MEDRCRICLEEFTSSPIKPCNCSSGLFHKECLEEWVRISKKKICEVCLEEFNCLEEVKIYKLENIIAFTLLYFVIFSMMSVIIFTLDKYIIVDLILKIVLYVLFVITFFSLIFFSMYFLTLQGFFYQKRMVVIDTNRN